MTAALPTSPVLAHLLDKFAAADACWYSSVRADGRSHLAPIWHCWHENAAWVVTQRTSVRARNLAHSPSVSLALPDPMNALILEGTAQESPRAVERIRPVFLAKYSWDIATDADYGCVIEITPVKLLAWGEHGEGRWRFDPARNQWSQTD